MGIPRTRSLRGPPTLESWFVPMGGPFRVVTREAGTVLQRQSEPVDELWLVRRGRVSMRGESLEGTPRGCSSRGPGSLLGVEAFAGGVARRDTMVITDAEVGVASVGRVRDWALARGEAPALVRLVAEEAEKNVAERALAAGPALARVARFLVARNQPVLSAWRAAPATEVACLLGMRPETLSRALHELERRGLVEDGRHMHVIDERALRELGGDD